MSSDQKKPGPKWIGVLLSFFVPGFGLIRAGEIRRGIFWFVGLQIAGVAAAFMFALDFVPIWVSLVFLVIGLIVCLWMWKDSFRPGKMTWKLSLLFIALLSGQIFLPSLDSFVARSFKLPTSSMEPTLMGSHDGSTADHIYANKLSYLFHQPKRGDLIVFKISSATVSGRSEYLPNREMLFLKRIVGLPDERIEIRDGSIYANGIILGKADGIPPIHYTTYGSRPSVKKDGETFLIGENEYFVLGDNSENSSDSRMWGYVPASAIVGKITKIYYPFHRMGKPRYVPEKSP